MSQYKYRVPVTMAPRVKEEEQQQPQAEPTMELEGIPEECTVDDEEGFDGEDEEGFEYPDPAAFGLGEMAMLGQVLVTEEGETVADILSGIRDALEKGVKVLYKLSTTLETTKKTPKK